MNKKKQDSSAFSNRWQGGGGWKALYFTRVVTISMDFIVSVYDLNNFCFLFPLLIERLNARDFSVVERNNIELRARGPCSRGLLGTNVGVISSVSSPTALKGRMIKVRSFHPPPPRPLSLTIGSYRRKQRANYPVSFGCRIVFTQSNPVRQSVERELHYPVNLI